MTISCAICNQHITEVIDILDKHKALRNATGRLIQHINTNHVNALGDVQRRVMTALSLVTWILTVREFAVPIAENKEEVDKALAATEETILCMLRGIPPPNQGEQPS